MRKYSIAFVDDHPILLNGLAMLFQDLDQFKVVAAGICAADVVDILLRKKPDLLVLDLNMPGDAYQAIDRIKELSPGTRSIAFTASANVEDAVRALESGAAAYVLKGSTDKELLDAIDTVLSGDTFVSPNFAGKVLAALSGAARKKQDALKPKLSFRESQIVKLLLCGHTNREIGCELEISENTVKHYMTLLMQKLDVRNRVEVVLAARSLGAEYVSETEEPQRNPLLN